MEPIFNYKVDRIVNRVVLIFCFVMLSLALYNTVKWPNSIHNPVNRDYLQEVAFNEGIEANEVTQKQFNNRYNK